MDVGVLYIGTGKYRLFWEEFYESAEKHFLPNHTKHYYVWSNHPVPNTDTVTWVPCTWLGWPYETLKRFERFLAMEDQLLKHDVLYFVNANARFLEDVGDEVLPEQPSWLVAALHAEFWKPDPSGNGPGTSYGAFRVADPRPKSLAYYPDPSTHNYIMGGFNGGRTAEYLTMARTLSRNIQLDMAQGIIAKFNDESHMNKYSVLHPFKLLPPDYLYPEGWELPCKPKLIVYDKHARIGTPRKAPTLPGSGLRRRLK